jgi:cobalt-zinc-cadmium efflux system outer membrane protein
MYRGIIFGVLTLCAAAAAAQQPAVHTQPDSLTITRQQAIDLALSQNPQLRAAGEQVAEARARVVQARAIPDPALTATIVGQPGLLRPSNATEHDYGLGLTIPFPDRIRLKGDVAAADVQSARFSTEQLRQQVASQTSQTYDSLLVALRNEDDFQRARSLAQEFLTRTEARFTAGTAPRLDVIKAKVDLAQAQNQVIAGERDIANARAALNRLMGRLLDAPLTPAESLSIPDSLPSIEPLEARALQTRPELRGLAAERAGASAGTTLAKEFWLPDFTIAVTRLAVTRTAPTYDTGIGVSFPIFFWQHTGGEVAESRHRELELAATDRDLRAQVGQEVRAAYTNAATALLQARYLRDELLPEAERAYQIASKSYALGGSSALEVLDARRTLLDAATQYTAALGAANDAIARLQLATGARVGTATHGGVDE